MGPRTAPAGRPCTEAVHTGQRRHQGRFRLPKVTLPGNRDFRGKPARTRAARLLAAARPAPPGVLTRRPVPQRRRPGPVSRGHFPSVPLLERYPQGECPKRTFLSSSAK